VAGEQFIWRGFQAPPNKHYIFKENVMLSWRCQKAYVFSKVAKYIRFYFCDYK